MSDWINVKDRAPTPQDSPILAFDCMDTFSASALEYQTGWDGKGWYESNGEYGMGLNKDEAFYHEGFNMLYWMPLPKIPDALSVVTQSCNR